LQEKISKSVSTNSSKAFSHQRDQNSAFWEYGFKLPLFVRNGVYYETLPSYHAYMFRSIIDYNHRTKMERISTMACFQNKKLKSNVTVKIMPIGFYTDFYCV